MSGIISMPRALCCEYLNMQPPRQPNTVMTVTLMKKMAAAPMVPRCGGFGGAVGGKAPVQS